MSEDPDTEEVLSSISLREKLREQQPAGQPNKHKRDVILEFYSSPDAILNALHQAGWAVVPKATTVPTAASELEGEQLPRLIHRNGDLGWENADHSVDYIIGIKPQTASIICKSYHDRILSRKSTVQPAGAATADTLLPCPFCGGENPYIEECAYENQKSTRDRQLYNCTIICRNSILCGCSISHIVDDEAAARRDAIRCWNNRPTSGKQEQEWTHEKLQGLLQIGHEDRYVTDSAFENALDEINASLAAERIEGWYEGRAHERKLITEEIQQLREQLALEQALSRGRLQQIERHQQELIDSQRKLASAQALIMSISKQAHHAWECGSDDRALRESTLMKIAQYLDSDTTALDAAIAAAQQPLVELLGECRCKLDWSVVDGAFIERIDAAITLDRRHIWGEDEHCEICSLHRTEVESKKVCKGQPAKVKEGK